MIAVSKYSLGHDVVGAIARAKQNLHRLPAYAGRELNNAQAGRRGARFVEVYVGQAKPEDPLGRAGSRRLVSLIQSGQIKELYFSDNHYRPGSWRRILDF